MSPKDDTLHCVRLFIALGLALATAACGDDTGNATGIGGTGGEGGAGGTGGQGIASGGHGSVLCRALVRQDLDAWCGSPSHACELSPAERRIGICAHVTPAMCGTCIAAEYDNSCGGRTLMYTVGGDAYSERYDYNDRGELVGVYAQGEPYLCDEPPGIQGGTACDVEDSVALDCKELTAHGGDADAGAY